MTLFFNFKTTVKTLNPNPHYIFSHSGLANLLLPDHAALGGGRAAFGPFKISELGV